MASVLIGRTDCPECNFKSAHVKQSEKCVYRYCPECSSQHHARTPRQREDLAKKTRLIEPITPQATPTPTPTEKKPASAAPAALPTGTPTPTQATETVAVDVEPGTATAPKRRGLFS